MDVDAQTGFHQACLHRALLEGSLSAVDDALVKGASLQLPLKGHAAFPLLLQRSSKGGITILERLLTPLIERGADINGCDEHGQSALNLAAQRGAWTMVRTLLDLGARILGPDEPPVGEMSAIEHTVRYARADLLPGLLAAGAVLRRPHPGTLGVKHGGSLLHIAAITEDGRNDPQFAPTATIRWLVEQGIPIDHQYTGQRFTPLMNAVKGGFDDRAMVLLELGANPNLGGVTRWQMQVTVRNYTPLHEAAAHNRVALAQRLLDAGADPEARIDLGDVIVTPLSEAQHHQHSAMVSLLEKAVLRKNVAMDDRAAPVRLRARL